MEPGVHAKVKFGIELTALPAPSHWWEPLFAGYGKEPDFQSFLLRWLGAAGVEFWCQGWKGSRAAMLTSFQAAREWGDLFGGEK